jgi:uncharacterized membrane protein
LDKTNKIEARNESEQTAQICCCCCCCGFLLLKVVIVVVVVVFIILFVALKLTRAHLTANKSGRKSNWKELKRVRELLLLLLLFLV